MIEPSPEQAQDFSIFVLMGVAGSGKSTVGRALASHFDCPFYDGDDYHPPENVAKMARGIPLTDDDRWPWLNRLAELIRKHATARESAVIACSALKSSYRDRLSEAYDGILFIYLRGSVDLLLARVRDRDEHYMKTGMLQSQLNDLEEPSVLEALAFNIDEEVDEIVSAIVSAHERN